MQKYIRSFLMITLLLFLSSVLKAQFRTKQEKGYFNITNPIEVQLMQSIDSAQFDNGSAIIKGGFEFNTINGYFLNPGFSVGLGVGAQFSNYRYYPFPGNEAEVVKKRGPEMVLLPVFADFRYYPKNSISSAMFLINAGYAPILSITNKQHKNFLNGGPLVKIGAAYKFYISEVFSFVPSVNFKAQRFGENTVVGLTAGLGLMF